MADEETITVANVDEGADQGTPVELPVVELLTGRAFLTGKSGSGKSNTASVVVEKLLDRGFGVLIVDIEGEYYGLKEEYEILHAGADEECDIQVSEEHAGKLASLALEQNVPIILDLSGFLHEEDARELLKAVARQLFAKEKKVKQPFLMVVEEIHEYVPEGGGMDECGRMLVKVAKRGRKHGLGVAGISQRPADVKKDFITQCDWLVWHRLTWQNDTRVVKRVLGSDYADAIEDMGDGEGFLMTDWGEEVRRVQFHRKETFDAGATPGLEDFERPDLKSVSDDLVSDLETISEEQAAREDEIGSLKRQLEEREQRIAELEEELAEARDLSDMAQQFARAMTDHANGRNPATGQPAPAADAGDGHVQTTIAENGHVTEAVDPDDPIAGAEGAAGEATGEGDGDGDENATRSAVDLLDDALAPDQREIVRDAAVANADGVGGVTIEPDGPGATAPAEQPSNRRSEQGTEESQEQETPGGEAEGDEVPDDETRGDDTQRDDAGARANDDTVIRANEDAVTRGNGDPGTRESDEQWTPATEQAGGQHESTATPTVSPDQNAAGGPGADGVTVDDTDSLDEDSSPSPVAAGDPGAVADDLRRAVANLAPVARGMLASYRDMGVATPESVHAAAGESGERSVAYSHNGDLRREGFVVHVGGGRYAYALPSLVAASTEAELDDDERRSLQKTVEQPL